MRSIHPHGSGSKTADALTRGVPHTPDLFPGPHGPVDLHTACRCGCKYGYLADGRGPHYRELRCDRGHHVAWLPWPDRSRRALEGIAAAARERGYHDIADELEPLFTELRHTEHEAAPGW